MLQEISRLKSLVLLVWKYFVLEKVVDGNINEWDWALLERFKQCEVIGRSSSRQLEKWAVASTATLMGINAVHG